MARTRWPSDLATPASSQARQIRPAAPVGARKPGPGRQIVSQDSPSGVSRIGGQAGTQAPTLRPYHHKTAEAGPEALSTVSLPNIFVRRGKRIRRGRAAQPPITGAPHTVRCVYGGEIPAARGDVELNLETG